MKRNGLIRFPALLLAAALLLGLLVIPASAKEFSDVADAAWYLEAVEYVSENGFMVGTSETEFSPGAPLTRAMFVTILYRLAGTPEVTDSSGFADVSHASYYAAAVTWAKEAGVVNGTSATTFSPNQSITRQDAVTMLYRYGDEYAGWDVYYGALLSDYADADLISRYAEDAMEWAVATGVVVGTSATTLSPRATMTRAQAAAIIYRCRMNIRMNQEGYAFLSLDMISGFTLTNAEGEYLAWEDDGDFGGNMVLYSEGYSTGGVSMLQARIPRSSCFRIVMTLSSTERYFRVGYDYSAGARGTYMEELVVDQSGVLTLTGQNMEFRIYSSLSGEKLTYILKGSGADAITVHHTTDGLSVTGLNGTCTVEIHNLEDITSITAEFDAGTGNTVSISPEGEVTVVPGESA